MLKNKRIILGSILSIIILVVTFTFIIINQEKKEIGDTCIVQFETSGGSEIKFQEIEKGLKIVKPENPLKEGFTFIEWQLDDETYNFENIVNNDITLTAVWKANADTEVCTVTFDSSGGSEVESKKVKKGNTLSQIANPTREGHIFQGWYLNNEIFDFNSVINNDILLTAKWEKNNNSEGYNQKIDKVIENSATPETPTISITPNTSTVPNETDKNASGNNSTNNNQVDNSVDNTKDDEEKAEENNPATSMVLSQNKIELYRGEYVTVTYKLYCQGYEVNDEIITSFGGDYCLDIAIEDGTVTFRAKAEGGGTIWFYGSQGQYLGQIDYMVNVKPALDYIVLEKDSVVLNAPIKEEYYYPRERVEFTIVTLEPYSYTGYCNWEWYSSNEDVAKVENVWGIYPACEITSVSPGTAIVTVKVNDGYKTVTGTINVTVVER